MTDNQKIQIYLKGFNDELDGIDESEILDPDSKKIYHLGKSHAIIGDELSEVDNLTELEILTIINNL